MTASLLHLLKYGRRAQLEALAKLAERDEGFDDRVLLLEAMKRSQEVLKRAYEAGKVAEEGVNGVLVLGMAYMWMNEYDECEVCYKRAEEGFVRLLGE